MKIIQEGKDPKKQKYKGKCDFCKCKIECDGNEVKTATAVGKDKLLTYVECPTPNCGRRLFVNPKDKSLLD